MSEDIMETIEKTLKYWVIDRKLGKFNGEIKDLTERLELALGRVIDPFTYYIRLFDPERRFTIFCTEKIPTGQYTINIKKEVKNHD